MTFSPNNFQPRGKEKKAQEEEKSAMEEEELYRINVYNYIYNYIYLKLFHSNLFCTVKALHYFF